MTGLTVPGDKPSASRPQPQDPERNPYSVILAEEQRNAQRQESPQQDPERNPYSVILSEERRERERDLALSLEQALKADPNLAGEAQRLSRELGPELSPLLIERNLERVQEFVRRQELTAVVGGSVLAEMFRDPMFARIAHDDVPNLGALERWSNGWRVAALSEELGRLRTREGGFQFEGKGTPLSKADGDRLLWLQGEIDQIAGTEGLDGAVFTAGQIVRFYGAIGVPALETGLAAGLAGGIAMLAGGVTAPAAPAVAAGAALVAGGGEAARQSLIIEGGLLFDQMLDLGVDPERAWWLSRMGGAVIATSEFAGSVLFLQGGRLITLAARKVVRQKIAGAVAEGLAKPSVGEAAILLAEGILVGVVGESLTEGFQEAVGFGTEEIGLILEGKERPEDHPGLFERVGDAIVSTAQGMALVGLPLPGGRFIADVRRVQRAETNVEVAARRAALLAESKVAKRNPSSAEEFLGRTLAGGRGENTFIPAEKFAEALQQTGKSIEDISKDLPEVAEQLPGAIASGGDIIMPTARYEAYITNTDLGNALAQHTRKEDIGYSEAEIPEVKAAQKAMVGEVVEETKKRAEFNKQARAIEVEFEKQLNEAKIGKISAKEAKAAAVIRRTNVEILAEKLQVTPDEVAARFFPVQVVRGEAALAPAPAVPEVAPAAPEDGGLVATEPEVTTLPEAPPVEERPLSSIPGTTDRSEFVDPETLPEAPLGTEESVRELLKRSLTEEQDLLPDPDLLEQAPEGITKAVFDPETDTIALFEDADITSILHELAHGYLNAISKIAATPDAPAEIVAQMNTFLEWRGIEGGVEAWSAMSLNEQRPHHEALAEEAEAYFFKGVAPSEALRTVFASFRQWITRLWRNYRGQIREADPAIRSFFDRMLASDDAIAHAEAVRDMRSVFDAIDTTDAQQARGSEALNRSTEEAVNEMGRRSFRDMQYIGRARDKITKERKRQKKEVRDSIRFQVKKEVEDEPVYRAWKLITTGKMVTDSGTEVEVESHKLETAAVREILPDTDLRPLRMTSPEGLAPDVVAGWFDFSTGEELVRALEAAEKIEDVIDVRTDQRMLDEFGELADAAAEERAVVEVLHNTARARFLATGLKALTGSTRRVRVLVSAARAQAQEILSGMPIAEIKPWRFQGAEVRANRAAWKAASKDDLAGAMQAQTTELIQHELAREAAKVERFVEKAEIRFKKYGRKDSKLTARDIDLVNSGRELLARVQFTDPAEGQAARQQTTGREILERDFPPVFDRLEAIRTELGTTHYRALTLDEFRELTDTLDSLWKMASNAKIVEIDGRKFEKAAVTEELRETISKLPRRTAPGSKVAEGQTAAFGAGFVQGFWHWEANVKKLQHWVRFMDGGKPNGPFEKFILRPMMTDVDQYRADRTGIFERLDGRLRKLRKQYGRRWDSWIAARPEELPVRGEDGEVIPGKGFRFRGVRELLGTALDMGNLSNQTKRLVSEGWALNPGDTNLPLDTRGWDAFFARMIEEKFITPEFMEYVSAYWGEHDTLLPTAQKVYKDLTGHEFVELGLFDVELPWGKIKGGYAPLRVDRRREKRPRRQPSSIESIEGMEHDFEYSMRSVSTGRKFTKDRNPNFFDRLTMDIGRRLQGFDEELRFIHLQPHVRTVLNITEDRTFSDAMNAYDREAIRNIILPWLESTARQVTTLPGRNVVLDEISTFIQAGTLVAALGMKFTVAAVQLTGFISALGQVKARYWWAGVPQFLSGPKKMWDVSVAKSIRMEERLNTHIRKVQQHLLRQGLPKPLRAWKAFRQEGARAAMLPIRLMQGAVDVITWHGAYQQSHAESAVDGDIEAIEKRAVQDADLAVERSQGSNTPEGLSRSQIDTPFMKLWFQFLNFSNTLLNQALVRAASKSDVEGSRLLTATRRAGAFVWLIGMVSFFETGLRSLMAGLPDDDEDDFYLDDLAESFVMNMGRNVAGMAPIIGPSIAALASGEGSRLSTPAASITAAAVRGVSSLFGEDESTGADIRAFGNLLSLVSGWPVNVVARPLAYQADVEAGKIDPTSPVDRVRGLIIGR